MIMYFRWGAEATGCSISSLFLLKDPSAEMSPWSISLNHINSMDPWVPMMCLALGWIMTIYCCLTLRTS